MRGRGGGGLEGTETMEGHPKKPKQGDHWEKYCLLFLPLKCVISKQYNIGRISSSNC